MLHKFKSGFETIVRTFRLVSFIISITNIFSMLKTCNYHYTSKPLYEVQKLKKYLAYHYVCNLNFVIEKSLFDFHCEKLQYH